MRKRANKSFTFLSLTSIMISIVLALNIGIISTNFGMNFTLAQTQQANKQQQQITLTAILEDQGDPTRWKSLLQPAMQELKARHPDMNIELKYTTYPSNQTRTHMLAALTNQTPVDLISVDQIWLGEFAAKGLLTDFTNYVTKWGRASEWYPSNFAGGVYKGKVYGIWAWTDVRGIWYWKDLLNKAGVDER
jgi:multiple sugar transport system substrate-binding protein